MLICTVFGLLFLLAGALFCSGVALRWVPGWRQMPQRERAMIRIGPLCRNVGGMILLAGMVLLLAGLLPGFRESGFRLVMLGWFALGIADVVFIGRSGRYTTEKR